MEKEIRVFLENKIYCFCIDGYKVKSSEIISVLKDDTLLTSNEKCTFENLICICKIYVKDEDDTDSGKGNSLFLSIGLKLIEYNRKKITTDENITIHVNKDENNNYSYDILGTQENTPCNTLLKVIEEIFQAYLTSIEEINHSSADLPPARPIEEVYVDMIEGDKLKVKGGGLKV